MQNRNEIAAAVLLAIGFSCSWMWLFLVSDANLWSPFKYYSTEGRLLECVWNFALSLLAVFLLLIVRKTKNWSVFQIVPVLTVVLGVFLGVVFLFSPFDFQELIWIYLLIGVLYGLFFLQWGLLIRGKGALYALQTISLSLVLTAVCSFFIYNFFSDNRALFILFLPVAASLCFGYLFLSLRKSGGATSTKSRPDRESDNPQVDLLLLAVVFVGLAGSLALKGSQMEIPFPFVGEWNIGGILAGALILFISRKRLSSELFTMFFGTISGLLCLSIVASLLLSNQLIPLGALSVSMTAFWAMMAIIMTVPSLKAEHLQPKQEPLQGYFLLLIVFFAAGTLWKLARVVFPLEEVATSFSAVILAFTTIVAFYLSNRSKKAQNSTYNPTDTYQEERAAALQKEFDLTNREVEVMILLAKGNSLKYIAEILYLSPNTVKTYRSSLYLKIHIHSRQDLIRLFSNDS